ncbi:BTB domain-containing protein [Mycena indigotica]|uniref:BTB domain-containing protein n=1 Tax=Mycena indigotica TaxID=2126181 RepID=A0A8H6WC96_9AGAR|nr:BTB domain-containing protein [Mycena indigotica]KAF7312602.1 BTB domain-containing protein [Mycena indigotica]
MDLTLSSPNSRSRRSEIWHPDGSVVLEAVTTQFRVHWSVLALHSTFFRGLLDLPQPLEQSRPSIEGCPVVELSDAPEDIEQLLKALYDPLFFVQKALPLKTLGSVIRICRKYEFHDLLQTAIERVNYENPTRLDAYDALKTGNAYTPSRIVNHHGLLFDTITLAWENNLLSVLPCAYYRALVGTLPPKTFDGIPRGDGTMATLAPVHQRACALGRAALFSAQWDSKHTFGWTDPDLPPPMGCRDGVGCKQKKLNFFRRHVVRGSLAPFCTLAFLDTLGLCAVCVDSVTKQMVAGRKKMWDDLPGYFGLPPWKDLKDDP